VNLHSWDRLLLLKLLRLLQRLPLRLLATAVTS
jgi:hypothetical protein